MLIVTLGSAVKILSTFLQNCSESIPYLVYSACAPLASMEVKSISSLTLSFSHKSFAMSINLSMSTSGTPKLVLIDSDS